MRSIEADQSMLKISNTVYEDILIVSLVSYAIQQMGESSQCSGGEGSGKVVVDHYVLGKLDRHTEGTY